LAGTEEATAMNRPPLSTRFEIGAKAVSVSYGSFLYRLLLLMSPLE
jgi:hypothetical protein